jgi:hypothetical protein
VEDAAATLEQLLQALSQSPDEDVRKAAADVLGRRGLRSHVATPTILETFRESWLVPGGKTLDLPRVFLPEQVSLLTLDGPDQLVTTLRLANIDRTEGGAVRLNTLRDVEVRRHCWIGLSVRNQGATDASFTATVRTT